MTTATVINENLIGDSLQFHKFNPSTFQKTRKLAGTHSAQEIGG